MNELSAIIQARLRDPNSHMVLATVVKTSGSSFRRPGARMLFPPRGGSVGTISGGCLEQDVLERSRDVPSTGKALILTYDTGSAEEIVFGSGLGCDGAIHILVEPLPPQDPSAPGIISFLNALFQRRASGALATVIAIEGPVPAPVGAHLMLHENGEETWASAVPDELKTQMRVRAREALQSNKLDTFRCDLSAGVAEIFVEPIRPPTSLVLFGAGYTTIPLVRLAKEVGYHVIVVDSRPAYATVARFPEADAVLLACPEEGIPSQLNITSSAAAVIMSHQYSTDVGWLKLLMGVPLLYLGLMGSRRRAEKMLEELRAEGDICSPHSFDGNQLHNPAGLDIGAETPEEIALAILAEIQSALTGCPGGPLRLKKGPIHAR